MGLFIFTIISCSSDQPNEQQATVKKADKTKKHMLSEQEKMLEKAKEVEKAVKDADEKRRKALEDQGG